MRKKIKFSKLFNLYDNYIPEMWFEIYRWMIKTGWEYRQSGNGIYELLIGKSTCVNCQENWRDRGFSDYNYIDEMRSVWMRAILSDDVSCIVKKWRKDNGISFAGVRHLNLQIADRPITRQLTTLFNAHKSKLTVQLNEYHPEAINIDQILLITNGKEWYSILDYGFNGSAWHHILAEQGEKTFSDFLDKACDELSRLTGIKGKVDLRLNKSGDS